MLSYVCTYLVYDHFSLFIVLIAKSISLLDGAELLKMDEVKTAVVRLLDNILKANNSCRDWL